MAESIELSMITSRLLLITMDYTVPAVDLGLCTLFVRKNNVVEEKEEEIDADATDKELQKHHQQQQHHYHHTCRPRHFPYLTTATGRKLEKACSFHLSISPTDLPYSM